ncbi:MAG: 2-oxo acid dehydrogenase subunit E2 [Clostridia bacterium]|nr:2-oxo acid dehydrogenase subunit E2 [Clostridia bacterium]
MAKRSDACNSIELNIPLEPMQNYLRDVRARGHNISHLALIIAAFLRTTAEYPFLNRFVVNKTIYARNEFAVGMVVLKPGQLDGTMNKMYFELEDDIFEVQKKVDAYVDENRGAGETNSTDKLISTLLKIPGLCRFGVCMFKLLDKWGLLPRSIIEASPFHTSFVISNLASIRTNHIFHHIYDFGTTSMILTMGNSREVPKRVGGEIKFEKCMPFGLVMDERICSGSYYALAFRRLSEYLRDPKLLEEPPRAVNKDI